jgi:phosphoribosylamine--glycine ligase
LKIIGASRAAARLESSKAFAKDFMQRHQIPTAIYRNAGSPVEAIELLNADEFGGQSSPVVVKADGLAAGKGVVVAADRDEAVAAISDMESLVGSDAASSIVLEECLVGTEVSLILFCDGKNFSLMPPTRDHKRIGDGDTGPNTGGMGTVTDDQLLSKDQTDEIIEKIIKPTLVGCTSEGFPFRGILFLGLMMTADGPKLLEYNVRFGDPETQAIIVRLETDIVEICNAMLEERLDDLFVKWTDGCSACVILASEGYPRKPKTGDKIVGLEDAEMKDITIFHSGTASSNGSDLATSGGRVLGVTAIAEDLETAVAWAYTAVEKISWPGMQFRKDIGKEK